MTFFCLLTSLRNQWFTAIYAGLVGALYWCLLVNGFVGFQWAEDGTPMSLWVRLRQFDDMILADHDLVSSSFVYRP